MTSPLPEMELLRGAYDRAVSAALPAACLGDALERIETRGRAVVLGAGKAAAAMAATFKAHWQAPVRGLVVTPYGHGLRDGEETGDIDVIEAAHPSPDSASVDAGARLLAMASSLGGDETLYWLVSGGGSALAAAPLGPLGFEQKRDAADFLIRAGADIREINCVRKHLSGLKGGRLAKAAHPHAVTTFAISDVPGDDPADIASGPTIADATTQQQAKAVLGKYGYPEMPALAAVLDDPQYETPKPQDPAFARDRVEIVATAATALSAAVDMLTEAGYEVLYLGDDLADEARVLGMAHAALALSRRREDGKVAILSGGETRVALGENAGRGGRNLEYLAGLAIGLGGADGVSALAADTDGIDGRGGHAGGFVIPGILELGEREGTRLEDALDRQDSYTFFDACKLLLVTGPTRTNVNDFRLILCEPKS